MYEDNHGTFPFGFNLENTIVLEEVGLINRIQFYAKDNDVREIIISTKNKFKLDNAEFELCDFTNLGLELFKVSRPNYNEDYAEVLKKDFLANKMVLLE